MPMPISALLNGNSTAKSYNGRPSHGHTPPIEELEDLEVSRTVNPSGDKFIPISSSKECLEASETQLDSSNGESKETEDEKETLLMYKDAKYKETALSRLNTMRRNRELCDVVFYINQKEIYGHKAVLAAASGHLYDMFTSVSAVECSARASKVPSPVTTPSPTPCCTPSRTLVTGEDLLASKICRESSVENGSKKTQESDSKMCVEKRESYMTRSKNKSYFEFNDVDCESFEALVNYAYTACLKAPPEKVKILYKLASLLKMQSCAKACAKYLVQNLSPLNCIAVRKCANRTNDSLLASKVDAYIQQNFTEITQKSKEFTALPCVQIQVVLADDQMSDLVGKFRDDYHLGEMVLSWIQTEVTELPEHIEFRMEQLTDKLHMLYMTEDFLLKDCCDVDNNSSVGSCENIQDYKKSARKGSVNCQALHLPSKQKKQQQNKSISRFASNDSLASDVEEVEWRLIAVCRSADCYFTGLCVLQRQLAAVSIHISEPCMTPNGSGSGAVAPNSLHMTQGLSSSSSRHSSGSSDILAVTPTEEEPQGPVPLAIMNTPRCSVGAVNLNGNLVVCGGYDRGECLFTVEMYDSHTNTWSFLTRMVKERGRFDATICGGKIFAVGGSDGHNDLSSVEVFDPVALKWSKIAELPLARSNNGCTSAGPFVYSIGGWNGQYSLKNCDRYDPTTNTWSAIPSLNQSRYQVGCTTWRNSLLAVGGCDSWNCLNSVEMFDTVEGKNWTLLPRMSSPRRGCGVTTLKDKLYVVGGSDGTQSLASVEIFDFEKGSWTSGPTLNTPRANVRAVTVGDRVYAVGGFSGKVFLNTIEYLEDGSSEWKSYDVPTSDGPHSGDVSEAETVLNIPLVPAASLSSDGRVDSVSTATETEDLSFGQAGVL